MYELLLSIKIPTTCQLKKYKNTKNQWPFCKDLMPTIRIIKSLEQKW